MNSATARLVDKYLIFGLASRRMLAERRAAFHRHNEVELLYVERGEITHLFGAEQLTFGARQLTVFWGVVPHLPVAFKPGTLLHWLTVPLAWVLQWKLPSQFSAAILQGRIFCGRAGALGASADLAMFMRWHADLKEGFQTRRHLVLLECEARLRRLLLEEGLSSKEGPKPPQLRSGEAGQVEAMAAFVAQHYTEPLTVGDIARVVELHPDYAGALFRKAFGITLLHYITELRLSHAQRLLTTTDAKIIDVAFAAGFGSESRFYAVFLRGCGQTPHAYRGLLQACLRPPA